MHRNVACNANRFPEDFRFQLTKDEFEILKSQIGISSDTEHGGRRTLPYAYTEQGISMLSGVLRSDVAIDVSIGIMRAFVEMRRFIAHNTQLFERIERVELKQLTYQKETDEKSALPFHCCRMRHWCGSCWVDFEKRLMPGGCYGLFYDYQGIYP